MPRAVIFDAYPHVYGGGQRSAHLLALGLPDRGWDVDVITTGTGVMTDRMRADGIEPTIVPVPHQLTGYGRQLLGRRAPAAILAMPKYWRQLSRALARVQPDVVFVASHRGLLIAGLPARRAGAFVWHVGARSPSAVLNRLGAGLASGIVVPADGTASVMPQLRHCDHLVTAASPIPDRVRRETPVELTSDPVIATTGRIHPDKGYDVAIDALAIVRRTVPAARLVVIGGVQDGYEGHRDELIERAGRAGVGDAVEFTGFHPDPHDVVAGARAYLQTARQRTEILPLAIVEAMATGVPVVATDVGAVAEVVRDGETGCLVPPEDPAAMADALVRTMEDGDMAERHRTAAFEMVRPPARTEEAFVDAVAGLFDTLTAAR